MRLRLIASGSMPSLLLSFSTGIAAQSAPVSAGCTVDFDSTYVYVTRDYAGYTDRMRHDSVRIRAVADSVRRDIQQVASDSLCTAALARWIAVFREHDHHIQLWQPQLPPAASSSTSSSTSSGAASGARTGATAAAAAPTTDPGRPSLRFLDDSTAVITLPSFSQRYRVVIDSLVTQHRAQLLATPFLLVDVQRNGGGWSGAYRGVMELIYTDPIRRETFELWSSPGTVAAAKEMVNRPDASAGFRADGLKLIAALEANPGGFVPTGGVDSLVLPKVYPLPRRVAVVTGKGCASSCEQFVMDAMYSRKVTVFGKAGTAGFLDYGNVVTKTLPSGIRRLAIPSARSSRLPERPLDNTGILPTVMIPRDHTDPIAFAAEAIRK